MSRNARRPSAAEITGAQPIWRRALASINTESRDAIMAESRVSGGSLFNGMFSKRIRTLRQ